MTKLGTVVRQLKTERDRATKEVERLNAALAALNGAGNGKRTERRGRMSAAARARIAARLRERDGPRLGRLRVVRRSRNECCRLLLEGRSPPHNEPDGRR